VLADRLAPAISALAERTPLQVTVSVDLPRGPPPVVESAAYFVAAEALANTGSTRRRHVEIEVRHVDGGLSCR
jgi:signal transduction histidine kinase